MERREPARDFRDLIVWQRAHALVLAVYRTTCRLPKEETYGLQSQMRRAAVSIPANIAEGFKKRSRADKARFFNISQGSLEELRYYFILCEDLGMLNVEGLTEQIEEVSRLLNAYAQRVAARHFPAILLTLLLPLTSFTSL